MTRPFACLIVLCFASFLLVGCTASTGAVTSQAASEATISIANWNLQIFGEKKASDAALLNAYAEKISKYDVVFVQEIRDESQTAFPKLCAKLPAYDCVVSSRAGSSSSKEQYGIIYKKQFVLVNLTDFSPSLENDFERPPVRATFEANGYRFSAYNIHTKPEDVPRELTNLEKIMVDSGNVIVLGDLNADCSYYDNSREKQFDSWNWVISDGADTTVSKTDCAYDRILLNSDAEKEFVDGGVDSQGITSAISDHYLVWVRLKISGAG